MKKWMNGKKWINGRNEKKNQIDKRETRLMGGSGLVWIDFD